MDVFQQVLVLPDRRFGVERVVRGIFFFVENLSRYSFSRRLSPPRFTQAYLYLERKPPSGANRLRNLPARMVIQFIGAGIDQFSGAL